MLCEGNVFIFILFYFFGKRIDNKRGTYDVEILLFFLYAFTAEQRSCYSIIQNDIFCYLILVLLPFDGQGNNT